MALGGYLAGRIEQGCRGGDRGAQLSPSRLEMCAGLLTVLVICSDIDSSSLGRHRRALHPSSDVHLEPSHTKTSTRCHVPTHHRRLDTLGRARTACQEEEKDRRRLTRGRKQVPRYREPLFDGCWRKVDCHRKGIGELGVEEDDGVGESEQR